MTIQLAKHCDKLEMAALLQRFSMGTKDLLTANSKYWIYRKEGQLQAMVGVEYGNNCALVRSLAVEAGAQRSGLGRRLLIVAIEDAKNHGCKTIFTLSSTAANYFTKLGFEPIEIDELRRQLPSVPQVVQFDQEGWPPARRAFRLRLEQQRASKSAGSIEASI
jgi:amino-acid N-acetyltransferase